MAEGVPPEDSSLVERDSDLASLVAALARPSAVAVVEGEPGIGKTSLVRTAIAEPALANRQQLLGFARPTLASCPLGPVTEALATTNRPPVRRLSALSGVLRSVLPDLADILPPEPPPLADPQLLRHRLVRATAELLSKLGPTILVLEDLQWVDDDTVELLRMISARPPPELSVVITCSSSAALPMPAPATIHLHLMPLSPSAVHRLASTTLGDPGTVMPRELANLLYERSGGVPGVVREDVLLLRERGLLRSVDGEWAFGSGGDAGDADLLAVVPPAVSAEIIARVQSLDAAGRAALEAAAVLAESAEPGLVASVTGMDTEQACAALKDAARCGLLHDRGPDGTLRFRHELARLAVYQAIPGYCRPGLHAAAARELVGTGHSAMAERAVEHHRRAGDIKAWAAGAEAAAEIAAADGSFEAAHAYLRDILQADAVAEERRAEVTIKLGWRALGGVDRTGATAALLTAVRDHGSTSPAQQAELRMLRAWSSMEAAGSRREADAAVREMSAALGDVVGRADLHAITLAVLAMPTRLPDRDLPTQMAYLDQARAALTQTTDEMAHAVVLTTAAHLLLAAGSPEGWSAADALAAHADRPDVNRQIIRGLLNLADAALHLGHHSRSLELVERGRGLAAGARWRTYDPQLRATALRVRWTTGDIGADEQVSELVGDPQVHGRLHARLLLAQIRVEQGRLDVARRILRAVAEEACGIGELAIAAHAVAELNRAALTAAQCRAGHAVARQVLNALIHKQTLIWAAPLLPFVPLDLVHAVLPRYRDALAGRDAPLARAALSFAEARLSEQDGEADRAWAGYRRARDQYAALPAPRLVAHACACEVRTQMTAGQAPDAEVLRYAWSTFTGLGAVWDANRLKQLIRAAGLPVPHRRGRRGYGDQLSPREQEIAGLAAAGHTNREIAANLYLSDRTVKYHLANAMRKLQVGSRRELRDVLTPESFATGPAQEHEDHTEDHTCRCMRCGRELNPS
ncbi:MAG TPA: LuxR C-terminal-related transcriptional regulator [Streptosporangiaceae bacterium]|nr:LuxR C-terminal-related transcriptional regulator [Streptosporangiaceae bacterium]